MKKLFDGTFVDESVPTEIRSGGRYLVDTSSVAYQKSIDEHLAGLRPGKIAEVEQICKSKIDNIDNFAVKYSAGESLDFGEFRREALAGNFSYFAEMCGTLLTPEELCAQVKSKAIAWQAKRNVYISNRNDHKHRLTEKDIDGNYVISDTELSSYDVSANWSV